MNTNMNEWKIAVIGAGTMGTNIAFCFALHGYEVNIYDINPEGLKRAVAQMESNMHVLGDLDGITDQRIPEVLGRVHTFSEMEPAVKNVDFVMEAVFEDIEVKKNAFANLSKYCRSDTILGSNTSTLNIYDFVVVDHPERLAIVHFGGPAHIMKVVEIVRGPETSSETMDQCAEMMKSIGKIPMRLEKAVPGFLFNRMFATISREAAYIVGNGWATPEDVDKAIINTYGPLCPFGGTFIESDARGLDAQSELADEIGSQLCNSATYAAEFYQKYLDEGKLGVKSGEGIFKWEDTAKARAERDFMILQTSTAIDRAKQDMIERVAAHRSNR